MEELDNQAVDAAIILENRIRERIRAEVYTFVREMVSTEVRNILSHQKGAMMMELTTSINQMLKSFVDERRKPLWESKPEDFGLTNNDFTKHNMQPDKTTGDVKEIDHAVHENTPSV